MYYAHTLRKFNGFTHVGVIAISSYSCTDVLLFIMVGIYTYYKQYLALSIAKLIGMV